MSNNQTNQNSTLDKWLPTIIVAVITVAGSVIVALINQSTAALPLYATQTSEARLIVIAITTQAYLTQPVDTLQPSFPSETPTVNEIKAIDIEYTAVSGDTLSAISRQYFSNSFYADAIGRANCIDTLKIDDKVLIKYYTVQGGDYLNRIAANFETSVESIQTINNFDTEIIYPGQILILPIFEKCE